MRLSTVLSEYQNNELREIESIIDKDEYYDPEEDIADETRTPVYSGTILNLNIGTIVIHFFCNTHNDTVSYTNQPHGIHCLVINNKMISIDCILKCIECDACQDCEKTIQAWFLIEADNIFSDKPVVRIVKYNFKLPENIKFLYETSDCYSEWFAKAEYAYRERLGAGSVIYLRTIFENLTKSLGDKEGITEIYLPNGKMKPFEQILATVDKQCSIIPELYKKDGYNLFRKLSDIAHGKTDEQTALYYYPDLRRLVQGVVDNVKNKQKELSANQEIKYALANVGFSNGDTNG